MDKIFKVFTRGSYVENLEFLVGCPGYDYQTIYGTYQLDCVRMDDSFQKDYCI